MNGRFEPGTHLRVWRPPGYYHHGIYINDDRVIQFGSGVNLGNKRDVGINTVPLEDFEQGRTAEGVRHGYVSFPSVWHPPADESWKIIERAEFLLKLQPRTPYNLIGHNCEIIANMCVTGGWTESYQTRSYFGARLMMDIPLSLWIASRNRMKLPVPRWAFWGVAAGLLSSVAVKQTYDGQIKRFWQEIRADWRAHEQALAQDPRNGQADKPT